MLFFHPRRIRYLWIAIAFLPVLLSRLPPMEGIRPEGQSALGLFGMAVILWVSGAVPLAVTGLSVLALLPVLGVMKAEEAFGYFGNSAVFFILGAFVLAAALMQTGLSQRISLFFLARFGRTSRRLGSGILITSAFLSCFMPMHAVAALLFPTVSSIAESLQLRPRKSRLAVLLYLSMAWGCTTGSVGTLLGGARAPLALGILSEFNGERLDFVQWTLSALPIAVVLTLLAGLLLNVLFPPEIDDISPARRLIEQEVKAAGPMDWRQRRAAFVTVLTVAAWVFLGGSMGMATLSLLSAFALFTLKVVTWEEVEESVNWGVLLMYGGAIVLGTALSHTGATDWVALEVLRSIPESPFLFLAAAGGAALLLTEFISNVAAVAVLLPVALSLGAGLGLDARLITLAVAIPAGLPFTMPMGTSQNAIALSSGYYEVKDVLRAGLLMSAISYAVFLLFAWIYWPRLPWTG